MLKVAEFLIQLERESSFPSGCIEALTTALSRVSLCVYGGLILIAAVPSSIPHTVRKLLVMNCGILFQALSLNCYRPSPKIRHGSRQTPIYTLSYR